MVEKAPRRHAPNGVAATVEIGPIPRLLQCRTCRQTVRMIHLLIGVSSPLSSAMLMKLSGHTSVRSLAKYARISDEGLVKWQAENDPAARRRPDRR